MQIEIKEVVSRRQLRRFAAFPNKLYKHNAYYVPQLLSGEMNVLSAKKNPAFEFCEAKYWFACEDNKVVGRVAGIIIIAIIRKQVKSTRGSAGSILLRKKRFCML